MNIYKYNILIVDDDISVFEHAKLLLSDSFSVTYASGGTDAIKYFMDGNFADIILLDIMMPEMDGYETLQALKQISACKSTPIIFLTGACEPSFEIKALKSGAKDFIAKPFDALVFLARIELCLSSENYILYDKLEKITDSLTVTELTILKYISKGYSNEEISNELHYSYGYVKQLVSKIFEKLAVTSRKELKQFYRA